MADKPLPMPHPDPEDIEALRRAREVPVDRTAAEALQQAIRQPTLEELRNRPIMKGQPFRL